MIQILSATVERWPVAGSFVISRGAKTHVDVIVCTVGEGVHVGRGEGTAGAHDGLAMALAADTQRDGLRAAAPPRE